MDWKWTQPQEVDDAAVDEVVVVVVGGGPAKLIGLGVGWWIYKKMQTNSTGQDTGDLAEYYQVEILLIVSK